ncbi:MAG: four helix bundle protein [Alphaproteobacteria bacterium]|nr:four helix bundle protein [Alphaproteobacteria bacterium]MBU2270057.1 four helix bundle protein [Alphaproteobacteria bacterium]MBU2418576.1 four helix bundle protein [Alphaproteobacteria bacterium]
MALQSHRELTVWRKAVDLACEVYRLTREMPKEEMYRLSAQIIRCSSSIAANIAEGNAMGTRRDYAHFVSIARGSAAELETFLIIIRRLRLAPAAQVDNLLQEAEEISRMLNALRSRLRSSAAAS